MKTQHLKFRFLISVLAVFCLTACCSRFALAVEISPTVINLTTDKSPYQHITLYNNANFAVPLEITIHAINFNPNSSGNSFELTRVEDFSENELMVFPPALTLAPGSSQSIRIMWQGGQALSKSKSYFVRFSPLSIVGAQAETEGVKIHVHFNALIHVLTSEMQAQLVVSMTNNDEQTASLEIDNQGPRFAVLDDFTFTVETQKKELIVVGASELISTTNSRFIPPSSKRQFQLPLKALNNSSLIRTIKAHPLSN